MPACCRACAPPVASEPPHPAWLRCDYSVDLATLGSHTDGAEIARDMGEQLLLECNYRAEAAAQTAFREAFADLAAVRIPAVIETRRSSRVPTTTYAEGHRSDLAPTT
jgi:predicted unusual protein kinase regulating ubiquinone biosynthesis (AarF/ABC1/UbiB family)